MLLVLTTLLAFNTVAAASSYQLEKVVEISRHGVRSPTFGGHKAIERGSARRWPAWQAEASHLTVHGYRASANKGRYLGEEYRRLGLLDAGCPDKSAVYIRASPLQRTRATAQALAEGAFPGCDVPVHYTTHYDPLFQSEYLPAAALNPTQVQAATLAAAGGNLQALRRRMQPEIARLQQAVCKAGKACPAFEQPWRMESGGDGRVSISGLRDMSDMAESIRLAWNNNNPPDKVAFNKAKNASDVARLLPLLTLNYDLTNDVPYIARRRGAVLLDQVSKALQLGISKPDNAPPDVRWLLFVAHDTNVAYLRTQLRFNWQLGNYPRGNIPPASSLVFERWRDIRNGERFLRVYFQAQTLDQIRHLIPIDAAHPQLRQELWQKGCRTSEVGMLCPYNMLMSRLRNAIEESATTHVHYD